MKKANFTLILFLIIIVFFSCYKEEILELDNIENGGTEDVLSLKKNGEIWKPRKKWNFYDSGPPLEYSLSLNSQNSTSSNFEIIAERKIKDDSSNYIVYDRLYLSAMVTDTGTFSFNRATMEDVVGIETDTCYVEIENIILDSTGNNFLRIIDFDTSNNALSGFFEFTNIDTICNYNVSVTEGRFRIGFEE